MSALGHKRTFAVQNGMSALPPKADMCNAQADVRYVPEADMNESKLKLVQLLSHALGRTDVEYTYCQSGLWRTLPDRPRIRP
jgi:hypothetical protein